ncbi:MAG: YmdB family metallophosphoesterase [Spirochaetaceae bacterium]|jgi:metallophosphoesterase (TIGR00282 family)|nr:YmdB family metallophosphoesterase [Spirochaetaceae bacterium]
MRIIMVGDVVGEPGLLVLESRLPALIAEYAADFTVVNGENAAEGFGLTAETLDRILAAGADAVTGGNHIWEKREFWKVLATGEKPVLRPANYPSAPRAGLPEVGWPVVGSPELGLPGVGWLRLEKNGRSLLIVNLQGRELMTPIDCPFRCFDSIAASLEQNPAGSGARSPCIIVDFHAESTEEKEALGYYLDGRASVVAGTHTHIQTADERLLPKGTAYITDLGMTGAMNGVIGMDTEICINRAYSQVAYRMECARPRSDKDCAIQGIIAELGEDGRAVSIERINR